jgi:hypothetical protein
MLKKWFIFTLVSGVLGFVLGFTLLWVWSFFRMIFLGYGDSGPSWIIIVNDVIFYGGLLIGVAGGQLFFFLRDRVDSFVAKLAKKKQSS